MDMGEHGCLLSSANRKALAAGCLPGLPPLLPSRDREGAEALLLVSSIPLPDRRGSGWERQWTSLSHVISIRVYSSVCPIIH